MEGNVIQEKTFSTNFFAKVFIWMFMGLFATGLTAWVTYATGALETLLFNAGFSIILIVELVVVIVFSLFFRKLSPLLASILFFIYSVVNGVTFASIFYVFELNSIILLFFAAAAIFGITAAYGMITKNDLSKIWPVLFITLIIGLIVSIVNLFIGNTLLDVIIDWVILLVFFGITAYDMQKIKNLAQAGNDLTEKAHIYGAMELYLDFINIFLRLLSIFGKRRN